MNSDKYMIVFFNTTCGPMLLLRHSFVWGSSRSKHTLCHTFQCVHLQSYVTLLSIRTVLPQHCRRQKQAAAVRSKDASSLIKSIPRNPWGWRTPTSTGLCTCHGCPASSSSPAPSLLSQWRPRQPLCLPLSWEPACRPLSSHLPSRKPAQSSSTIRPFAEREQAGQLTRHALNGNP